MNTVYKSNSNIVYSCKYHVVWCPKYRRKILTNGIDTRLKELLFEYAANISVDIMEMEIMPDHVHILLEFGIHKTVKHLKSYTIVDQIIPCCTCIGKTENPYEKLLPDRRSFLFAGISDIRSHNYLETNIRKHE